MAEDGTGGRRLPQARRRRRARVRRSLRRRSLARADPRRQRSSRSPPAGRGSARPTAASSSSSGRRRSRPRTAHPVDELLELDARARRGSVRPADDRRPRHPRRHRHQPGAGDELDRAGRRRLPRRQQRRRPALERPAAAPRRRRRGVRVAHFDGERWSSLGAINRDPGVSMRPPTAANAPQIAIGPTGNGDRRLAGARHRRRRADLGAADLRRDARLRAAGQRHQPRRRADRRRRRRAERLDLAPRPSRGRLPAGRRAGLAAAGPADLPQHAARRRIGRAAPSSQARASPTRRCPAAAAATVGPPSIDIDEKQDLRLLYDANGTPRVIEGTDRGLVGALSLGPPFAGRRTVLGERDEPGRRRHLGVAERRRRRPAGRRGARGLPRRRRADGSGQRRRGRDRRRTRGRALGARRRPRRLPAGPVRRRRDRRRAGHRAAGALRRDGAEKWIKPAQASSPGCRPKAPTARCATRSCSTAAG